MSYFPIQNARGEREKYPRLRSGLRTDGRILPLHLFSRNFFEILESFCVTGAVFGEVQLSLFVAGAAFGEIWNDSRSAKCCIFQYKMLVGSAKSNLGCEAGCGRTVLWSDHGRILLGSFPHCK